MVINTQNYEHFVSLLSEGRKNGTKWNWNWLQWFRNWKWIFYGSGESDSDVLEESSDFSDDGGSDDNTNNNEHRDNSTVSKSRSGRVLKINSYTKYFKDYCF